MRQYCATVSVSEENVTLQIRIEGKNGMSFRAATQQDEEAGTVICRIYPLEQQVKIVSAKKC